jgi:H+/Cl- antiporter ClcA
MMWDYVRDIALWAIITVMLYMIFAVLMGLFASLVSNSWIALRDLVVFWKHATVEWNIMMRVVCWILGGICAANMME